jgi:uncharacterized delta-60 repeat protein
MRKARLVFTAISFLFFASTRLLHAQAGALDFTFNPGSGADAPIYCMAFQTNGQIVIGGNFAHFNGANQSCVARLNADGSLDSSFNPGVGPFGSISLPIVDALAVQPNGDIIIGGPFFYLNGLSWNQPARFRVDGSVDTSFNTSGANGSGVPYNFGTVKSIVLQADGKVLIGGGFSSVALGNGYSTNFNSIARLNTNGTVDLTFNPGKGANYPSDYIAAIGLQSSGQIIVGGTFASINRSSPNYLARLNTDGSVDSSFNAQIQNGNVQSLVVTPQDQIVIGGSFTSINGYSRNCIARLNADGSVDTTFNPGAGANIAVTSIALQPDGKMIVSIPATGSLPYFNGVSIAGGLARLNTNGTLDVTFNSGTGPNINDNNNENAVVASQPDGKTLISGSFTSFNGTNINGIARLNSDTSSTTLKLLSPQIYFGTYLQGTVSNTYRIEYTSQLNTPSLWTPLLNVTLQTNPQFILDPNPASGQRFYRTVQVSP